MFSRHGFDRPRFLAGGAALAVEAALPLQVPELPPGPPATSRT